MDKHFKEEQTLVIIKPDGVQRSLVGEIITRFERVGFKLIATKMMVATPDHIEKHYTLDPGWRKQNGERTIASYKEKGLTPPTEDPMEASGATLERLRTYMSSGPVIVMIWQGAHVVQLVRKLIGGTEPLTADIGTIRGDFVLDSYEMSDGDGRSVRNLIHASGSVKEAEDEIAHWFEQEEIMKYGIVQEKILYEVNLDDILE